MKKLMKTLVLLICSLGLVPVAYSAQPKQKKEKAAASGAARSSADDRTCAGRWSGSKENVNGSLSGKEGPGSGPNLNGNVPETAGQEEPSLDGTRTEGQEGADL